MKHARNRKEGGYMKAELRRQVLIAINEELPKLTLTADMISKITRTTLSALAKSLRQRTNHSGARLLEHAGNSVQSLLEG
jgi:hypothetical protein